MVLSCCFALTSPLSWNGFLDLDTNESDAIAKLLAKFEVMKLACVAL